MPKSLPNGNIRGYPLLYTQRRVMTTANAGYAMLPETAISSIPHCVYAPVSGRTWSFSWSFPIDVEGLFAADSQFPALITSVRNAAQYAHDARRAIEQQIASCVPDASNDLKRLEDCALDTVKLLESLREIVSTYAHASYKNREKLRAIRADAKNAGLTVRECGESATIILEDTNIEKLKATFDELDWQKHWIQEDLDSADYEFYMDLNRLNTSVLEQSLSGLAKVFLAKFFPPNGRHALYKLPSYLNGCAQNLTKIAHGAYLVHMNATFQPSYGSEGVTEVKQFFDQGKLENWQPKRGAHAPDIHIPKHKTPIVTASGKTSEISIPIKSPHTPQEFSLLEKGGKIAGRGFAIIGGGLSAYESYQSDSYHHPEMGTGEKIARAGIKGSVSGLSAYGGAIGGAKIGAAIGAFGGVPGIIIGGFIGGIVGGYFAERTGTFLTNMGTDGADYAIEHFFG